MMYKNIRLKNIKDNLPEYKFKLPKYSNEHTLGRFNPKLNHFTFEQEYDIIIDIKRIIKYCNGQKSLGWNTTFDQLFSHIVSHEYIHYLLLTQIGKYENESFDNLFGVLNYNPKFVYSGIKFENEILPKRHNCTKHINTKKNKIGMVKKE